MAARRRLTWRPVVSKALPLVPQGSWKNLTPAGVLPMEAPTSYGASSVAVAPSNNDIVFALIDQRGLYKSTDGGKNWAQKGPFDAPLKMEIDPSNPNNCYLTQGVRGSPQGFHNSTDGGETWVRPAGFETICGTVGLGYDVTWMDVDPTDFLHIIISSHSPWTNFGGTNAGILESTNGGASWSYSLPGDASWPSGTLGVNFLRDPATGQGDAATWLVNTETAGTWKTTNHGSSYSQVAAYNGVHGGQDLCYAPNGNVLSGGYQYPIISTDNGNTWAQITSLPFNFYFGVWRVGNDLYTAPSNAGSPGSTFYKSSDNGVTWAQFIPAEPFINSGPYDMTYAPTSGILYSASLFAGVIATRL